MGNAQNAGVRIANLTEVPLVYVIKQVGPSYWGVIKPGKRVSRHTGRVWFTVETYPYDGTNEPTSWQAVKGPFLVSISAFATVAIGGAAAMAAVPAAGSCAAALAPIVTSPIVAGLLAGTCSAGSAIAAAEAFNGISKEILEKQLIKTCNHVSKAGHYANGDWIHVKGGPKKDVSPMQWKTMHFVA